MIGEEHMEDDMQLLSVAEDDLSTDPQSKSIDELTRQCQNLIDELKEFSKKAQECLSKQQNKPEVGPFNKSLQSELKSLDKIQLDETNNTSLHHVASSNIPYYLELWDAAKRSHGILNIRKGRHVDIVAENGLSWVKVSTFNNKRLLYELAKEGCERYGLEDDDSDDEPVVWEKPGGEITDQSYDAREETTLSSELPGVSILKTATQIAKDAQEVRVRGTHPRLTFVLPRIYRNADASVDAVLSNIQGISSRLKVTVLTGTELRTYSHVSRHPPLDIALEYMLPTPLISTELTDAVNIDCSVLLAMVSDISHLGKEEFRDTSSVNKQIRQQIQVEEKQQLMEAILWPLMVGDDGAARRLMCTAEAAQKFVQIVETMGTDGERERAAILMGQRPGGNGVKDFQALSRLTVPTNWRLPVEIMPADHGASLLDVLKTKHPRIVEALETRLTDINRSVFIHGWASGLTTLTSNRGSVRIIEDVLERALTKESRCKPDDPVRDAEDPVIGKLTQPRIRLLTTARSLLAKEKTRRDAEVVE
ncbi:hypothetical protein P152DRAFT_480270 [Eremomyces bilateralis CBS 781.70]|uniref:DUF1308 domain-containing protein n=1 Tax=Eremomyces bilateralis CBS 781.70 TaxID=1392243 RepID=A0A6G1GB02_9PEZI|nr:uncharacterized protein P152DRAFT_480270 [Eremomyces bilateralis CBS 781.70]KAF1815204.1 hypothetical protein P152DRAFT_480270 [Eremomyces bilateralis CBS 781.70]